MHMLAALAGCRIALVVSGRAASSLVPGTVGRVKGAVYCMHMH